jgi:succinate-semialdehyde dehydrogenase / glutarate-semialdehyde dehydrogenase
MQITRSDLFRQQAYIDGQWCNADGGQTKTVINPANGVTLGTIPVMGAAETRRAIEAAKRAQKPFCAAGSI